jgi:hypothetical protein
MKTAVLIILGLFLLIAIYVLDNFWVPEDYEWGASIRSSNRGLLE